MSKVLIFTDGGARGNPGPAALGVYIQDDNKKEYTILIVSLTTKNKSSFKLSFPF